MPEGRRTVRRQQCLLCTACTSRVETHRTGFAFATMMLLMAGCSTLPPSSPEELARFEYAGPIRAKVDRSALVRAHYESGPYRLITDDILELRMPEVMRAVVNDPTALSQPHVCRVGKSGMVTLPVVGQIAAAGKTLNELENAVVAAYHPKYCVNRPSVVITVSENATVKVAVTGAVKEPGVYALASDELSLVAALMKAGGIVDDGAAAVRIRRPDGRSAAEPIVLPVEGLTIAFADIALRGGETIEVVDQNPNVFSVLGLVIKAGTFAYPVGARYNLLQALAFAGGLDLPSDPRCIQVYREDAAGEIVAGVFDLSGEGTREAMGVRIKPGDVVFVADTAATMTRRAIVHFLKNVIRIGFYYRLEEIGL